MISWADRSLLRLSLVWWASLVLLPLLLIQASMTRRLVLRLPEGQPPNEGSFGSAMEGEQSFTIVGLGDSVIAGVGVTNMSESLTANVARQFSIVTGQASNWYAYGVNGETINDLLQRVSKINPQDANALVVSIGVNDVTRLTSLVRWQFRVTHLVTALKSMTNGPVIILGVPPMQRFTALPQPLRWVLGIRATMLDVSLEQIGQLVDRVYWVDSLLNFDESHLARDGFHPNPVACDLIAQQIVSLLANE